MPRARHAGHPVEFIQADEIRQLQGCHADHPLHRNFQHGIPGRYLGRGRTPRNQQEMDRFLLPALRILDVEQTARIGIPHAEAFRIAGFDQSGLRAAPGNGGAGPSGGLLFTRNCRQQENGQQEQGKDSFHFNSKDTKNPSHPSTDGCSRQ